MAPPGGPANITRTCCIDWFADIDECESSPCQNGGQCIDEVNDYTCLCLAGFTGTNCKISKLHKLTVVRRHSMKSCIAFE